MPETATIPHEGQGRLRGEGPTPPGDNEDKGYNIDMDWYDMELPGCSCISLDVHGCSWSSCTFLEAGRDAEMAHPAPAIPRDPCFIFAWVHINYSFNICLNTMLLIWTSMSSWRYSDNMGCVTLTLIPIRGYPWCGMARERRYTRLTADTSWFQLILHLLMVLSIIAKRPGNAAACSAIQCY